MERLSQYALQLESPVLARYRAKIALCDQEDPYCMKKSEFGTDFHLLPRLEFPDICNYLLLHTSFYTQSQMKAYKSLEAYNFFVSGWVHDLGIKVLKNDNRLIIAKVNHSQRSTATPLKCWVIVKADGEVLTAHCNCMAGLGESCSHIGATLYAVETGVRMRESTTCTMEKCQWLMPSHVKKIHAARVEDIDFSSPRAKKKKLDDAIANLDDLPNVNSAACNAPQIVTGSLEHQSFLQDLQANCENSAALMVLKPFADRFQPKSGKGDLPSPLLELRSEKTLGLSFHELLDESQKIVLSLSASQIAAVERETRKQANSKTWYQQRAGRITASKLKAVLRTPTDKPSSSLIKSICYPEAHKFFSKATR